MNDNNSAKFEVDFEISLAYIIEEPISFNLNPICNSRITFNESTGFPNTGTVIVECLEASPAKAQLRTRDSLSFVLNLLSLHKGRIDITALRITDYRFLNEEDWAKKEKNGFKDIGFKTSLDAQFTPELNDHLQSQIASLSQKSVKEIDTLTRFLEIYGLGKNSSTPEIQLILWWIALEQLMSYCRPGIVGTRKLIRSFFSNLSFPEKFASEIIASHSKGIHLLIDYQLKHGRKQESEKHNYSKQLQENMEHGDSKHALKFAVYCFYELRNKVVHLNERIASLHKVNLMLDYMLREVWEFSLSFSP